MMRGPGTKELAPLWRNSGAAFFLGHGRKNPKIRGLQVWSAHIIRSCDLPTHIGMQLTLPNHYE